MGPWIAWVLAAATSPQLTAASTEPLLDAGRLRLTYLTLFGRPPFRSEREAWLGRPAGELLERVISDPELWDNWLEEQLYYFLLVDNFRPAPEELLSIPEELAEGELGVRSVLQRIALSSSFDRRNPGPDTFVTVMMEQFLGLTVQRNKRELEIGKKIYDGTPGSFLGKPGNSQADVVRIVLEDQRMLGHFLGREHRRLLRQEPAERDVDLWSKTLADDDTAFDEIVHGWIDSEAFERRLQARAPQPNRLFVRALFVDILDRLPREDEAQRMRNALDGLADSGPLRSVIARLLIDSDKASIPDRKEITDPRTWIAGLFERLLGRPASETELASFLDVYEDPSCKPATVLYAIVSHPEYQTW
jgi:hypothetical protein